MGDVHALPGRGKRVSSPARSAAAPDTSLPSVPSWLNRDARRLWGELVPQFARTAPGWLKSADSSALGLLVTDLALALRAERAMRGPGGLHQVVKIDVGHQGRLAKHPAFQVYRDASAKFLAGLAGLGLSPAARARLELGDQSAGRVVSSRSELDADREVWNE